MPTGLLVAFWAALGTAVGSFLNVVASRAPQRRSLLTPPSHCDTCGRKLGLAELVPVVSYLVLRGRCRTCRAPIGVRTLAAEIGTGVLFALAATRTTPTEPLEWVTLLLTSSYLAVLVVVTVTDLELGRIPNNVIAPAIIVAMVGSLQAAWPGLLLHLLGGLLGAGIIALIVVLVPGGMGWGDAKLAGFIGLATGLPGTLLALFVGFVSGGLVAGGLLLSGHRRPGDTVPLGPFLALGGGAALLFTDRMLHAFHTLSALL